MMITRYLLATAAVAFAGAVAAFAAVTFAGAAAAFGATPPALEAPAPPLPGRDAASLTPNGPRADAMRAKLKDMDTDHDGRWSKAEWLAGGRNAKGFDRMDTDHDGFLTPEELRSGMAAMRAARVADMPLPPAGGAPD